MFFFVFLGGSFFVGVGSGEDIGNVSIRRYILYFFFRLFFL